MFVDLKFLRSEIHENMNCARCKQEPTAMDRTSNEIEVDNLRGSCEGKEQHDVVVNDIGGFAEVAGCSHKLQSSQKQARTCFLNPCIVSYKS